MTKIYSAIDKNSFASNFKLFKNNFSLFKANANRSYIIVMVISVLSLSSCALNSVQYKSSYKGSAKGVITNIYRNNIGGSTVVLDGKLNVNVWDEDMDETITIGNSKEFKVRWLKKSIKNGSR